MHAYTMMVRGGCSEGVERRVMGGDGVETCVEVDSRINWAGSENVTPNRKRMDKAVGKMDVLSAMTGSVERSLTD